MNTFLAASIASLMVAGSAVAADSPKADGFRIESEAQFVRDYGDQIEQVGPGVFQVVKGPLAGKNISIGEAGVNYDLAAIRAMKPRTHTERKQVKSQINRLEAVAARYGEMRALASANTGTGFTAKLTESGTFPCMYFPPGGYPVFYSGGALVTATTELYLDRGDGQFNPYYARARATASGLVYPPYNVPSSISMLAYAFAHERQIGQPVLDEHLGITSAYAEAGYVYSGPAFFHDMIATATVAGRGNCYGYVSVTDSMDLWY